MKAGAFLPWVQVLRAVTDLPNSTRHSVFHLSGTWAVPCPLLEVKPLLVGLGSLGTALGTRPRRCTPISVSLVVVQTRPDIRIRVRRIVIRIRVRHTAIRIRVVVAAIDHTAYGSFHLKSAYCQLSGCKGTHFQRGYRKFHQLRRAYARFLDVFVPQTSRFALCRFAPVSVFPLTLPRLPLCTRPRSPPPRFCRGRPDATRHTGPSSTHRKPHSRTTHRHAHSR